VHSDLLQGWSPGSAAKSFQERLVILPGRLDVIHAGPSSHLPAEIT
jgi:hypothetical protein